MTKTAKRTLILTLALLLMLSLAALFTGFLKASAAEAPYTLKELNETELPDDLRPVKVGDDLTGKHIYFSTEWWDSDFMANGSNTYYIKAGNLSIVFFAEGSYLLRNSTSAGIENEFFTPDRYYSLYMEEEGASWQVTNITFATYDGITSEKQETDNIQVSESEINPHESEGTILDKASEWLQTNTGIAISSGGIVVIGVIILLLIFTKRK